MDAAWMAVTAAFSELPRALGHSLWQGAVIALVVYAILHRVPAGRSNLRYGVPVLGLCVLVLAVIATWSVFGDASSDVSAQASAGAGEISSRLGDSVQASLPPPEATSPPVVHSTVGGGSALGRLVLQCWAVGVALMLLRLSWMMSGVGALRRHSRLNEDVALAALLEEMKALMRVPRRVALRIADDLVTPVAMGLVAPAIVLPVSFLAGVPPQQLRAILAHELAHIRRYDYLVNFFQLMIESLLYFNPAVWWLSRQIRIEREACCDAIAARALGDALDYADALAWVTRYVHDGHLPGAAQAFGAPSHSDRMLDRIRRLLIPEYRPHLRLRWHSVALGGLMSVAVLLGLYQSAAFAKRLLTDEERIAVMSDLTNEYLPGADDPEADKIPFTVIVETYDGAPLPLNGRVSTLVASPNYHASYGMGRDGDAFSCRIRSGNAYVDAQFPGYAPYTTAPIRVEPEIGPHRMTITLLPSNPANVRLVNVDGAPVSGVRVTGGYKFRKDGWSGSIHLESDANGELRIEQGETVYPVVLRATAAGFGESEQQDLVLEPGASFEWVLEPDEPIHGVVVSRVTGEPVAGAEIALVFVSTRSFVAGPEGELVTTANDAGEFLLEGLARTRRYYYLVGAEGYGSELVVVDAGARDGVRVGLAPRYVRGVVRGDLALLKRSGDGETPIIEYSMDMHIPGESSSHGDSAHEAAVDVVDGVGQFAIDDLRAGELTIQAGPSDVRVAVNEPVENLEIDVATPNDVDQRTVIVNLPVPAGGPHAEGQLVVWPQDSDMTERSAPIVNGRAELTVKPPARIMLRTERLNGYIPTPVFGPWEETDIRNGWRITAGDEPFVIEMPLERAGAIHGQVLRGDGSPAAGAYVYVRAESAEAGAWPDDYFCRAPSNITCDADGRFAVLPVPFDTPMLVQANVDFARDEELVELGANNPIVPIALTLPEGVDVPVSIVDPSGRPMPDTEVFVSRPGGGHSGLRAGPDGVFVLKGADPNEAFTVEARPARDYQFTRIEVPFDGSPAIVRLNEGLDAHGVVQRADTGAPVPHVVVIAQSMYQAELGDYQEYEVKATADAEGKFMFTNLREGTFQARANASGTGLTSEGSSQTPFTAGQSEPVIVQLRPRK